MFASSATLCISYASSSWIARSVLILASGVPFRIAEIESFSIFSRNSLLFCRSTETVRPPSFITNETDLFGSDAPTSSRLNLRIGTIIALVATWVISTLCPFARVDLASSDAETNSSPSPTETPVAELLPSSSVLLPNWVFFAIFFKVEIKFSTSFWSACRVFSSFVPSLAACTASWRKLTSILLTSFKAPSVVWIIEIEDSELRIACPSPEICDFICSEITREAGPSAAWLSLRPEDNLSRFWLKSRSVCCRCLSAFNAAMFELTRNAMIIIY